MIKELTVGIFTGTRLDEVKYTDVDKAYFKDNMLYIFCKDKHVYYPINTLAGGIECDEQILNYSEINDIDAVKRNPWLSAKCLTCGTDNNERIQSDPCGDWFYCKNCGKLGNAEIVPLDQILEIHKQNKNG